MNINEVKSKIAKLLRLQTSNNVGEAANAAAFVEKLCVKYNVSSTDCKDYDPDKDEAVEYTGPNKEDRKQIKKMDDPSYAKKLADYEKNMDPKKRQALKDKATKGMKFTHEEAEVVTEVKDKKGKGRAEK